MKKIYFLPLLILFCFSGLKAQVTAGFTPVTPLSGCPNPFLVILNDNSSSTAGAIVNWTWTLTGPMGYFNSPPPGNNQFSATLTEPGFYTLTLVAEDNMGNSDTETQVSYIEVFEPPSFTYTVDANTGCAPTQICFDGTVNPGCGIIDTSIFDPGDGTLYGTVDFCHTYLNAGTYSNFVVSYTNTCGCTTTENVNETVDIVDPPIANFSANTTFSCTSPLNVTFTNTSTAPGNATYLWNIPGEVIDDPSQNLSYSFGVGTYDVELIVLIPGACNDTLLLPSYIVVGDPSAGFTSDTTEVCQGGSIQFFDNSTGAPSGWQWDIAGLPPILSQNPVVTFPTSGNYNVTLTTTYLGGCQDVVNVNNYVTVFNEPVNSFTVSDTSACQFPFTTTFTGTSTNSVGTGWQFPGGTPSTFTGNGPVNVTYNALGNYGVVMFDTTAQGCVSQTSFSDVIDVSQLNVNLVLDTTSGCIPLTVNYDVVTNTAEPIATYNWTFPGGTPGTSFAPNPSVQYTTVGCYNAQLTITTVSGCTAGDTAINVVCAGTPPTAAWNITPLDPCFETEQVCFDFTGSNADTIVWDFDNNEPPVIAGPSSQVCIAYSDDVGLHTPSMVAFSNGCPSNALIGVDTIDVLGPIAESDVVLESCEDWNQMNFTNTSTEADSVYFNFGDPTTTLDFSSSDTPSWTYPALPVQTTYTASITAYNFTTLCVHVVSFPVVVYPPDASFITTVDEGCAQLAVTLTNTSIDPGAGTDTRWNWDSTYVFGAPGALDVVWNGQPSRTKQYPDPGVYSILMQNTDSRGCVDTAGPAIITVHGIFGGFEADSTEGCAPLLVNFQDTSVAPITGVASWFWDFGDPSTSGDTSIVPNPTYTYNNPGVYTVTLTLVDSFGCQDVVVYANYVTVQDPVASFALSDTFVCSNQPITVTNQSLGFALNYDWQFQNGLPPTYNIDGNPPMINFPVEGVQDVFLEVTDNFGCTHDTTVSVSVFDVVAAGAASANFANCPNPPLVVSFTNTSVNNVDSSSVFWDFGNGLTSTVYEPTAVYSVAGVYEVILIVGSLSGCADTTIVDTIIVDGPYGELEILNNDSICLGEEITFAIRTVNASNPFLLQGDGTPNAFFPVGLPNDTLMDTITVTYANIGDFVPSLFFNQSGCTFELSLNNTIYVDSLVLDFDFSTAGLCDTGTVCFTDLSYSEIAGPSGITSWEWDFGDLTTVTDVSNLQNPCYSYTSSGSYTVTLVVTNSHGCLDTISQDLYIPESPIVQFAQSDSNGCENIAVMFFDSTTIDSMATISSWFWDFGDLTITGDTAIIQNPSYPFTDIGVYDVVLTVTDSFGCVGMDTNQIEVFALPNVVATNDTFLCFGDSLQLNASGALDYVWTPNFALSDDSIANPITTTPVDTSYVVMGTDSNGCSNQDSLFVDVITVIANFGAGEGCIGDTVQYIDSSQTDGGMITTWSWNFDDPGSLADSVSSIQNPTHIFGSSGNFDIVLAVTDDNGCSDDTTIVSTIAVPPTASFLDDSVCVGETINFDSGNTLAGSGLITDYLWEFGNPASSTDNVANPSFTYAAAGDYTVCLTVTSDLTCIGNSDDTCIVIKVFELPQADFMVNDACEGLLNNFSDVSVAGDLPIATSFWDFGQLPADTALFTTSPADTSFTYLTFGAYTASLTVADSMGCTTTAVENFNVFANPTASFDTTTLCQGQLNDFQSTSEIAIDSINNTLVQYDWDFDEGAGFVLGAAMESYEFLNDGPHDISLIVTDNFGCVDTVTNTFAISTAPMAIIDISDSVICLGEQINLNSLTSVVTTPTFTVNWDFDYNTGFDNTNLNATHLPNNDIIVLLELTDENGCIDSAFQNVDVQMPPTVNFDYDAPCEDILFNMSSTTVVGDGALISWNWTIDSIPSLVSPSVTYSSPTGNDTLEVILEVTDANGCTDGLLQYLYVEEQPILDFVVNDTLICPGDIVSYNLTNPNQFTATGVESISWSPTLGVDNPTADSVNITAPYTTTYVVTALGTNGVCPPDDDNDVTIEVIPTPFVSIDAVPNPVLAGAESEISLGVVPFNFATDDIDWNDSSGTLSPITGGNVTATPTENTIYNATITYSSDSIVCTLDTSILIEVIDECNGDIIYAPNIFTPNGDGRNDKFKITGYGLSVITNFRIFDRWGKVMYEGNDVTVDNGVMEEGWDGRNRNGVVCNSGVYVYHYEAICANGDIVNGNGNVTLIK